jgi:hypothetical protein
MRLASLVAFCNFRREYVEVVLHCPEAATLSAANEWVIPLPCLNVGFRSVRVQALGSLNKPDRR